MSYASSIEYDQGAVEIVVYNRTILLFTTRQRGGEADSRGLLPPGRHRWVTPPGVVSRLSSLGRFSPCSA